MMSLEQLQKEVMAEEAASSVSNMTDGVRESIETNFTLDYHYGHQV
jgi:hypothetical protein